MHVRTLLLSLALFTVGLAGCLGDDADGGDGGTAPPTTSPRDDLWLHRAGELLSAAELPVTLASLAALDADWRSVGGMDAREPTVAVTADGAVFYAARDYSGGQTPPVSGSQTPIMRSLDGGLTWEDVSPRLPTGDREPPRSGDPMVVADPWTDRVFQIELYDLVCNWLVYTDDGGDSWTGNAKACGPLVVDHQTIGAGPPSLPTTVPVGYDNVVYVCVNQIADSHCARSLDGGLTFETFQLVFPGVTPEGCFAGGIHGHVLVDPTGTVYLPREYCERPFVGISRDDGLTWALVDVSSGIGASDQDPNMAFDDAGNVYYLFIGEDEQAYVVRSSDQGATWSEPVRVTPPGITAANHPSITAGSDGRIGFVFTGTTTPDPPLGEPSSDDAWNEVVWSSYMGVSLDATSDTPTFAVTRVSPAEDWVYRGDCTHQRCGFMREFMDATVAPDGSFYGAFVDACLAEDEPRERAGQDCNTEAGDYGEGNGHLGYVGVTVAGPSLWADEADLDGSP